MELEYHTKWNKWERKTSYDLLYLVNKETKQTKQDKPDNKSQS